MQNDNQSTQQNYEHAVSSPLRTQRILEHLEQQLKRSHEPSHEDFKRIIEAVLSVPEAYRTVGLTTIAEHFVNGIELHLLALVAIFQEKAEREGISLKERQTTLNDVLPEAFQTLAALSKQVSVKSLDELAALNNVTLRLYTLSSVETAEDARRWLYELPATYSRRLRQAGLLVDEQHGDKENEDQTGTPTSRFVNWQTSYMFGKNQIIQEMGNTGFIVSTSVAPFPGPISVPIETSDKNLVSAA